MANAIFDKFVIHYIKYQSLPVRATDRLNEDKRPILQK